MPRRGTRLLLKNARASKASAEIQTRPRPPLKSPGERADTQSTGTLRLRAPLPGSLGRPVPGRAALQVERVHLFAGRPGSLTFDVPGRSAEGKAYARSTSVRLWPVRGFWSPPRLATVLPHCSCVFMRLTVKVSEEVVADVQIGVMSVAADVDPITPVRCTISRARNAVTLVGRMIALVERCDRGAFTCPPASQRPRSRTPFYARLRKSSILMPGAAESAPQIRY